MLRNQAVRLCNMQNHMLATGIWQVVVDAVDPAVLVSRCETKLYDFATCDEEELFDITIPLDFRISAC